MNMLFKGRGNAKCVGRTGIFQAYKLLVDVLSLIPCSDGNLI